MNVIVVAINNAISTGQNSVKVKPIKSKYLLKQEVEERVWVRDRVRKTRSRQNSFCVGISRGI